jgi:hypothetical protein
MNSYFRTLALLLMLLTAISCKDNTLSSSSEPRFKTGDSLHWAAKDYEDSAWQAVRGNTQDSVFWARFTIELDESPQAGEHLGVNILAFGAYEAYWDGVWIGKNGSVARSTATEKAGTESSYFLIPDSLSTKGKHVVALRASQAHLSALQRRMRVKVANYFQMVRAPLILTALMYILAGAFLVAAIYHFFLFINDRKEYPTLIFSITCFLFFALLMLEYLKFYVNIPYPHFHTRLEIIGGLTFAIAFLVPLYFTLQFSFPHRKLILGVLLASMVAIYAVFYQQYDETAYFLAVSMWVASFHIVGYAAFRKVRGGSVVLLGLLLSALINHFIYYDISVFISFTLILLCMLYLLALRAKETEQAYESSLLLSARLKNELLKKNIQPHFLMNTLTSLIDWVEESPREGVKFIGTLASEFELLTQVAEQTLIPIRQEIELCQSHLRVMQYRKEIKYHWEDVGIHPAEKVPPALLHTLLENGITHSIPSDEGTICFKLFFEADSKWKKYELLTIAKNRPAPQRPKEGTGFRYIKSRLKESYGVAWDLQAGEVKEGWKTTITIYQN